jgi:hypothetical protein
MPAVVASPSETWIEWSMVAALRFSKATLASSIRRRPQMTSILAESVGCFVIHQMLSRRFDQNAAARFTDCTPRMNIVRSSVLSGRGALSSVRSLGGVTAIGRSSFFWPIAHENLALLAVGVIYQVSDDESTLSFRRFRNAIDSEG